jgi:hypothetical protein
VLPAVARPCGKFSKLVSAQGVARFLSVQITKMGNYIPKDCNTYRHYQTAMKNTKWPQKYRNFRFQGKYLGLVFKIACGNNWGGVKGCVQFWVL